MNILVINYILSYFKWLPLFLIPNSGCVAWATAYAARTYYEANRQGDKPSDPEHIFSPAFIYNQLKSGGCDGGSSITDALGLMKNTGVASLAQFPYDEKNCSRLPNTRIMSDAERFRIDDWEKVDIEKPDDIKGQIFAGNPVIFGMYVSDSFDKLDGKHIYDDLNSPRTGGHAMVLVGYDEAKQAFKLINSWGKDWGDKGFGWISYRAFQKFTQNAFVMQLASAPKPPVPPTPVIVPEPIPEPVIVPPVPPEPTPVVVPPTPPKPEPAPIPEPIVVPPAPPEPEPTPVPIPEPVVVPPPPVPEIKPLTSAELQRKITELINGASCADLRAEVSAGSRVTLTGFAGQREDLEQIKSALEKLGAQVVLNTELRPWPQCEALLTLHDVLATPSGLHLSVSGGNPAVLNEGEGLRIEVTTPDYPSYLYLTYIQANGDAVYLVSPQGRLPKPLPANTHLVLGNGDDGKATFTISPPFGDEMIVAIASASPLFDDELPKTEIERDYLTRFRQAFLVKPESGATARVVSAAMTTLVTRAKP